MENRHKLREATAAEFGALRLHNLRRSKKILNGQQKSIKDRNRVFLEKVTLAKDRVARIQYSTQAGQNFDDAKGAFMRKVEKLYPAWQEHVQAQKMAALRDLEKERNEAQQRRLLAKKVDYISYWSCEWFNRRLKKKWPFIKCMSKRYE